MNKTDFKNQIYAPRRLDILAMKYVYTPKADFEKQSGRFSISDFLDKLSRLAANPFRI